MAKREHSNAGSDGKTPPAERARARFDSRGHLKPHFLAAFEKHQAVIYKAAESVGIDPDKVTAWKKTDPDFLAEFTRIDINCKTKENELLTRSCMVSAIEGDPEYMVKDGQNVQQRNDKGEPIFDALGRPVLVVVRRRFDGHLRSFLMERRMPEQYSMKIETKVSDSVISRISSSFLSILRRRVPEVCPHCKSHLGLHPEIVKELETLGAKMSVT